MLTPVDLQQQRILITGATGFVAEPIIAAFSKNNTVFAAARFKNPEDKAKVEQLGAEAITVDLANLDFTELPNVDYVINLAVAKSGRWPIDLAVNSEAIGHLMQRYQAVKGFLHVSSTAVYEAAGDVLLDEHASLGDNHRSLFETYSISKIAGESVLRFAAKAFNVPTVIARLNVPYGSFACWPYFHAMMMQNGMAIDVHPNSSNSYSPIHSDDYVAKIPYLLAAVSNEPEIFNLGGDEVVSIEQWCAYISELTGFKAVFNDSTKALGSMQVSVDKLRHIAGPSTVTWKVGIKRMLKDLMPDALIKP